MRESKEACVCLLEGVLQLVLILLLLLLLLLLDWLRKAAREQGHSLPETAVRVVALPDEPGQLLGVGLRRARAWARQIVATCSPSLVASELGRGRLGSANN